MLDGANVDEAREQMSKEREELANEINVDAKQFIIDNYENVLGSCVFMMMCGTMVYPTMISQVEDAHGFFIV